MATTTTMTTHHCPRCADTTTRLAHLEQIVDALIVEVSGLLDAVTAPVSVRVGPLDVLLHRPVTAGGDRSLKPVNSRVHPSSPFAPNRII